MNVTLEEYLQAKQIVKDYRICGNSCYGCGKLFKIEDTTRTIQYAKEYWWCEHCYKEIKDD